MASSLFKKTQSNLNASKANSMFNQVSQIKQMLGSSGNPNAVVTQLLKVNPQFANFYNQNKGKNIEQICEENGVDYSAFMNALGRRT